MSKGTTVTHAGCGGFVLPATCSLCGEVVPPAAPSPSSIPATAGGTALEVNFPAAMRTAERIVAEYPKLIQPDATMYNLAQCFLLAQADPRAAA